MDYFKEFIRHNYDTIKCVEKETIKNQNFMQKSINTWNKRHNGIHFSDRKELNYNQILFVDLGFGYRQELAFSHPCLLLNFDNGLCQVLPITSNSKIAENAYHPTLNPIGNKSYYLIPVGTCNLTMNSSVMVNQLRTVSEGRIINFIDRNGLPKEQYDDIRLFAFKKCFPDFFSKYNKIQELNNALNEENEKLKQEIEMLKED